MAGTNWTLISAVEKDTVLKRLYTFQGICYGLMLLIILIIAFVMAKVIYSIVSKPVRKLTVIITKITNGDFTVEIPVGGADEIGVMNNCMRDFVEKMRSTMGDNMDHERKNNWIMYIIIGALLIAIIGANMLYYVNKTETGKIVNVTKIGNGCSK